MNGDSPNFYRTLGALGLPALSTGEPHLVEPFMKHLAAGLSIPPSELFSTKKDVEEYAALAAFTRASNGDLSSVRSLAVGIAYAILQGALHTCLMLIHIALQCNMPLLGHITL